MTESANEHAIRRVLIAGVVAWTMALPLATLIAGHPRHGAVTYIASAMVYAVGAAVCHQRPERSFHMGSAQWPVCARCTGFYLGAAIGVVLGSARRKPATALTTGTARWTIGTAALPTLMTLVYEWTSGQTPENSTRAASGVLLGGVVAWILMTLGRRGHESS